MPLSSLLLLLAGGFISISLPGSGEAVVYYVTPTEPPNPDCTPQEEPCQTLDYYFTHQQSYFCNQFNVTMKLMKGEHTLKNRPYMDCRRAFYDLPGLFIEDLETFEMVGLRSTITNDVIVYLQTDITLINISISFFGSLVFLSVDYNYPQYIFLPGNYDGDHDYLHESFIPGQASEMSVNMETYMTTVNEMVFIGVLFEQQTDRFINFNIFVINSFFGNGSTCTFWSASPNSKLVPPMSSKTRYLEITNSTFINTELWINYMNTNVKLHNNVIDSSRVIINTIRSNVIVSGETALIFYMCYKVECDISISVLSSNVTIIRKITFVNSIQTTISAFSSNITLVGSITFANNTGIKGGAMALYSSTLNIARNTSVYFYNNTAKEVGGAIYVANGDSNYYSIEPDFNYLYIPCFYQLLDFNEKQTYNMKFANNSAVKGGDNIYGETMHSCTCYVAEIGFNLSPTTVSTYCVQNKFVHLPKSLSSVSSDPTRICICINSQPQCNILSYNIAIHPGELFKLPAVIVGADLGTTVGPVYAIFNGPSESVTLKPTSQYIQEIGDNKACTDLNFNLFSSKLQESICLTIREETIKTDFRQDDNEPLLYCFRHEDYITQKLLYSQPTLNIHFLPCPPGFTLLGDPPGCDCDPVLTRHNFQSYLLDGKGYHAWNNSHWLGIEFNSTDVTQYSIFLGQYCPYDYCNQSEKVVNIESDANSQCLFNRGGRLCGGCRENYSLAVGSSRCIPCSNNNNLALLVFFVAAGFLLVFFIHAFNLTVTQGWINGFVFYANILWAYQSILLPKQVESHDGAFLIFVRTIIAWINLDFGIETCFFVGLNAYWKTWMQYVFPFYIWSIVAAIIYCARHSTRLTRLIGDRTVSVLATLFLLSYTKLLRTVIASIAFTPLEVFSTDNSNHTLVVWSLDGHYLYCHFPHILLFIAALSVFFILWLPYTLVLFSIQWLRKKSDDNIILRWVPRFMPVYDVHLKSLKNKHHYWFGTLLIIRGALLIIFTSTYTVYPSVNFILLLIVSSLLLCYSNYHRVYKEKLMRVNENFFLLLLIIVGASGILDQQARLVVTYASMGAGILGFCGLIIGKKIFKLCNKSDGNYNFLSYFECGQKMHQGISDNAQCSDSESDPLISDH